MSKSGIPIISQVAETVNTIGSSIGDIFEGKNVFESLGRIVAAPIAAAGDLVNDISFNTLAYQPIAKDFFGGSRDFQDNPYSAAAAGKLAKGSLEVGAALVSAGAFSAGGMGISAGANAFQTGVNVAKFGGQLALGSKLGETLASGNVDSALEIASGLGIENPFADTGIDLSGAVGAIGGARPTSGGGSNPSIGVSNAVAAPTMSTGMDGVFILLIAAMIILLVFYYV